MTRKISMREAWKRRGVRQAVYGFVGCPEGRCGATDRAWGRLLDELPPRAARTWAVSDIMCEVLFLDHAGRYQAHNDANERVARWKTSPAKGGGEAQIEAVRCGK